MAVIDFPANPTVNQVFTAPNGTSWVWDGAKWKATAGGSGFLPISGGTLTGPLTLAADPLVALGAATKEYVDNSATPLWQSIRYRNRIINGDMSVDQRNGGTQIAMPAATGYIIDRWRINNSGVASKGNAGQVALAAAGIAATGYLYALNFATTTPYPTPAAADAVSFAQVIEGINFLDAQWGTANALPLTLEFWANSSVAGTYAVSLTNNTSNRSYVSTFTLPANAWTKIRLNILGDTSGTWTVSANLAIASLRFALCVGATLQTATLNAWQPGNFLSTAGAVNVLAVSTSLYITGVALMVGAAAANAEPEFRKYSDNLLDCLRYYEKSYPQGTVAGAVTSNGRIYVIYTLPAASSGGTSLGASFKVTKRSTPTVTVYSPATGAVGKAQDVANNADVTFNLYTNSDSMFVGSASSSVAAQQPAFQMQWTADADF